MEGESLLHELFSDLHTMPTVASFPYVNKGKLNIWKGTTHSMMMQCERRGKQLFRMEFNTCNVRWDGDTVSV